MYMSVCYWRQSGKHVGENYIWNLSKKFLNAQQYTYVIENPLPDHING